MRCLNLKGLYVNSQAHTGSYLTHTLFVYITAPEIRHLTNKDTFVPPRGPHIIGVPLVCIYMIKINEPQLPWLHTAIYHTGLDVKMEVTHTIICTCTLRHLRTTKERYTNQIPRQQPFKEKLLPWVGLEPTTFSVLG